MDNMAVALVVGSIVMPFVAWRVRSLALLVPSWLFNGLALQYAMILYAESVDAGSRLALFWRGVLWIEYALLLVNIVLLMALVWVAVIEYREERRRRMTMPP